MLPKEAGRLPQYISKSYYKCYVSVKEIRELVQKDEEQAHGQGDSTGADYADPRHRVIYKIWPDFPVEALINRSTTPVKADAAIRAFEAIGSSINTSLGPVATSYPFESGKWTNLDGNQVIVNGNPPSGAHSDTIHPETAWAALAAAKVVNNLFNSTVPSYSGNGFGTITGVGDPRIGQLALKLLF